MPSDLKTPYSHLVEQANAGNGASASSSSSSRAQSPLPPPPADADSYAYSTLLRRHEPESIADFAAHHNPLGDLKHAFANQNGGSTAYPPSPIPAGQEHHFQHAQQQQQLAATGAGQRGRRGSGGGAGTSHHPFAHTAAPLTPSARFATQSVAQTLSSLGTSASAGMDAGKVNAIREIHGPNEFEVEAKDPTWKKFIVKFYEDPLILLLLASAAVSAVVGNYDDAASILMAIFIVVTGSSPLLLALRLRWTHLCTRPAVGFVQEQRSEKSLEALNKLVPHYCHLIRCGLAPFPDHLAPALLTPHCACPGTAKRRPSSPTSSCPATSSPSTPATASPPTSA